MRNCLIGVAIILCGVLRPLPASAQHLTIDPMLPTSSCYNPEKYESGVNLAIFVDYTESMIEGYDLSKRIAQDLSRLKDTGKVVAKELPKGDDGELLVHFDVYVEYQPLKTQLGVVTGYAAVTHINEVCSVLQDAAKNWAEGIRLVDTPGFLILSTKEELLNNVEGWIYDNVTKVVKERRQVKATSDSPQK